ncbi:MAG: hypothetical protein QXP42_05865 [Candidatus Micrarchaeia archaeon]
MEDILSRLELGDEKTQVGPKIVVDRAAADYGKDAAPYIRLINPGIGKVRDTKKLFLEEVGKSWPTNERINIAIVRVLGDVSRKIPMRYFIGVWDGDADTIKFKVMYEVKDINEAFDLVHRYITGEGMPSDPNDPINMINRTIMALKGRLSQPVERQRAQPTLGGSATFTFQITKRNLNEEQTQKKVKIFSLQMNADTFGKYLTGEKPLSEHYFAEHLRFMPQQSTTPAKVKR